MVNFSTYQYLQNSNDFAVIFFISADFMRLDFKALFIKLLNLFIYLPNINGWPIIHFRFEIRCYFKPLLASLLCL